MSKNGSTHNFNKLNTTQKTLYFLEAAVFFVLNFFRENITSLSKRLRTKRSIKDINNLIKIKNTTEQTDFIENDNFNETEIESNDNINHEIIGLYNQIFNVEKIESIIYELITLPKSGSFFKFVLKSPLFNKLNLSISNIADCNLKLGEIFFRNNLYDLSIKHLSEASKIYKENDYIYYLIGINLYNKAKNIVNLRFYYDYVLTIVKFSTYIEALYYLKRALKLKPNDEKILNEIGNIYFDLDNFKQAEEYYKKIIKSNPNNSDIIVKMSIIHEKLYSKAKSLDYKQKTITFKEKHLKKKTIDCTLPNEHTINNENHLNNSLYYLAIANDLYSQNTEDSALAFQKALHIELNKIDQCIFNAYAYKNNNFELIANSYIELAIVSLENCLILIKRSCYENISQLQEKYFPVKIFQKRIDIISDYYSKKQPIGWDTYPTET